MVIIEYYNTYKYVVSCTSRLFRGIRTACYEVWVMNACNNHYTAYTSRSDVLSELDSNVEVHIIQGMYMRKLWFACFKYSNGV